MTRNISESVKSQLKKIANESEEPFQAVLNRFGIERLLYRISILPATRDYLLKGAQLFNLWYDQPFRATKDIDLLGVGSSDLEELRKCFVDISKLKVVDGIFFDPETIRVTKMHEQNRYPGVRVALIGYLNRTQWRAFLHKNELEDGELETTVQEVALRLVPILRKASNSRQEL